MKSPRDILLKQHRAAAPKLDAIRREVIRELNNQVTKEQSWPASLVTAILGCSNKCWGELVWPCRRIWAGLVAAWVLLLIVNLSQRDGAQSVMLKSPATMEMMTTFHDQEKILNDLLVDRSLPAEAERPRIYLPKPRTDNMKVSTA